MVEHLICTQMSSQAKASPILGLTVVHPPTRLLALTQDYRLEPLNISQPHFGTPPPLFSADGQNRTHVDILTVFLNCIFLRSIDISAEEQISQRSRGEPPRLRDEDQENASEISDASRDFCRLRGQRFQEGMPGYHHKMHPGRHYSSFGR